MARNHTSEKASLPSGVSDTPRIWVLLSDKQGDNGQVYSILSVLGWRYELKTLAMLPQYVWGKPRFRPTLAHLDREHSDSLEPPWPDLIITIGRRPSMAALWVKRQSGNRTGVVLVGKPSGPMKDYDLVISSAENLLPPLDNLLSVTLPLMEVDRAAVKRAQEIWTPRFAAMKKPLIAVLIGGPTGPLRMDNSVSQRLLNLAEQITDDLGGTPYFSTSRRTPAMVVDALKKALPPSAHLFQWSAESGENPYQGLLAAADGFIVTGDSISMMVEVIRLGKPLAILPLPTGGLGRFDQGRRELASWLFGQESCRPSPLRKLLANAVYQADIFKLVSTTRNFRAFHRMLIQQELAVWAGQKFLPPARTEQSDLPRIVSRIRGLVANPG